MLEDPETSDLISWSSHGDLFSVSNPTAFSKTVLPQYFKHNNWQSFVRQLNMYGFHKVNDLIHSNLTNENQTWEFKHPNFRRGAVNDLQHIKRKSAKTSQLHLQQLQQQRQQEQFQQTQKHGQQQAQTQAQSQQRQHTQSQPKQEQKQLQEVHPQQQQQQHQHSTNEKPAFKKETDLAQDLSDPVIKHILRIEDHLLGVTKSCEQLFNEVVHLRMVVSKQQNAMQDLVDVVSSSAKANNCGCGSSNNNSISNNKQELLDGNSSKCTII
ncbi:HSF-type DNA-binding-domain-containing protein [Gilbertella persicaria]|uniref:HSF-type DNA-binding-domain-containing protein n=1 Tax=Gilbertella persicaria TaxID=101096 RepID=UPI002220519A|nr:HSF-type DNA-binding-domain-containing protein [Gilbertella persicaria]KAI8064331.1 HSF-type DNA-binding-domain-containing protein [Gilbertella persicaria]